MTQASTRHSIPIYWLDKFPLAPDQCECCCDVIHLEPPTSSLSPHKPLLMDMAAMGQVGMTRLMVPVHHKRLRHISYPCSVGTGEPMREKILALIESMEADKRRYESEYEVDLAGAYGCCIENLRAIVNDDTTPVVETMNPAIPVIDERGHRIA